MTLDEKDANLFFELFMPLLDYVNRKCNVLENDEKFEEKYLSSKCINGYNAAKVADTLWQQVTLIDDYLAQAQLTQENAELVRNWKKQISGKFIVERHLKRGSVFINSYDEQVYLVKGLNSTWQEMLNGNPLPAMICATLLPWRNVIVTDGLVTLEALCFGRGYSSEFKEIYMNAKRSGKLIKNL